MPNQMAVAPFNYPSNVDLLDGIRASMSNEYQRRIPAATKAGVEATMNAMWEYTPGRNDFIDALVNVIGAQIVKYMTWTNPLAKFKRGMLTFGETIEEVAIGLAKAKTYSRERGQLEQDIFGIEESNVQSRFHKVNRKDWYKVSISTFELQRAFYNAGGLSTFVAGKMAAINTSDNVDEFLLMTSLFRRVYDQGGFYKFNTPDILHGGSSISDNAKQFLVSTRELSKTLTFVSERYNAAHMPMVSRPEELELILTPRGEAVLDVEALAGAFNLDKAQINSRITIVPEEQVNIPGFQGLLTTKDFFVVADQVLEMQNSNNPVMLHQNYFWHHQEVVSASPFENAILLTTEAGTDTIVVQTPVDGISAITVIGADGSAVANNTVDRGSAYEIQASATTSPAGGLNDAVFFTLSGNTSGATRILQTGVLFIAQDEQATTLTVTATATDDQTFTSALVLTVAPGGQVAGAFTVTEVDSTTTLTNTTLPKVTVPDSGPVAGATLTGDPGKWNQRTITAAYQWNVNGAPVAGATADTYVIQPADATKAITLTVTATKTGFTSGTATSLPVTATA
jgi:hypothetical protein